MNKLFSYKRSIGDERMTNDFKQHLDKNGIGNAIYYPTPLHKQPLFTDDNLILPNVESLCKQVLSIPVYPGLTEEEREFVVQTINSFEEQR